MNAHVAEEMIRLSDVLCQENLDMTDKLKNEKPKVKDEKVTETDSEYAERYGEDALANLKRDFGNYVFNPYSMILIIQGIPCCARP